VNFTSREIAESADVNRVGNLAGRELMDVAQSRGVRADFYTPGLNTFDDFSAAGKLAQATPMSGLTNVPSLEGIAHVFDMALGAGEGTLPSTPSSPDISGNQVLRWPAQTVTWPLAGTPDATNPRICLIVATPADELDDPVSRNILVDPVTRALIPQTVYKTSNPVSAISVVVGTAAAAPVAPAVPAGALALFEIYLPPLASDSTAFLPVRRAWRSIEFPGTSQHGIVKGCVPFVGAGFTGPILPTVANQPHRLVIDGELLTFAVTPSSWVTVDSDLAAPPVAAPVGNDAPAYLYLCGGRNFPHLNYKMVSNGSTPLPVTFIASLTPPDAMGYPTASLAIAPPPRTFPRAACCYVGLYFRNAGLTTMVPSFYDGDWIRVATMHNYVQPAVTVAASSYTAIPMPTVPASSSAMRVRLLVSGSASTLLRISNASADTGNITTLGTGSSGEQWIDTVAQENLYYKDLVSPDQLIIRCEGFNMNIPRLAR
jgi:hypothetical protein